MTREELIDCINDDINPRTCPEYSCNMPEEENNVGKCCRECAEKQLEDYEEKIRADERKKAERDFQNSDYWNEYLEKVIADARADERTKMLMPYDVESIDDLIENVRAKVLDEVIDIVSIACKFDEDNKAEMKQYILEQLKEQNNDKAEQNP